MNPGINITPANIDASNINFFGEVSEEGFRFILEDAGEKKIVGLSVYDFSKNNHDEDVATTLKKAIDAHPILRNNFNKTVISFGFNENVLIPAAHYNKSQDIENINMVFGDLPKGTVLSDNVAERGLHTVYRIPASIYPVIKNHFGSASFFSQYSLIAKQLLQAGNELKIIFYHKKIIAVLLKEGELQIIQTFFYVTADDVLYHMLNLCNQFDVTEVEVELSGMIKIDSPLSEQIHAYFSNVHFAALPKDVFYIEELKRFPHHFFSELFSNAICV